MDEERAAAWLMRQQALAETQEFLAGLKAHRAEQQEHAGGAEWTSVAPEAPKPRQRAPEPPQRSAGPPVPDKIQRPRHDETGRVRSIETYEGVAVHQLGAWEKYTADTVAAAIGAERKAARARLEAVVEALAGEVGADVGKLDKQIAEQAALIERLVQRIEQLEVRAAGGLREVLDADAAD